jgi:hypothetical protein
MANAGAEIDQCVLCPDRVPCIYIGDPDLKFERCRHAVGNFDSVVLCILTVLVQVNKTRRYDKSASIERRSAPQAFRVDRLDLPSANANIPDGVKATFWVHDATVEDHYVVIGWRCPLSKGTSKKCGKS